MTLLWTTPRSWVTKEPITKTKLNGLSDQLNYLYNPTRSIITVRGVGTNLNFTSTAFVDIDFSQYTNVLEMTGSRDLTVTFQGNVLNSSAGAFTYFDILMDSTTYLSSLTGTALGVGAYFVHHTIANAYIPVNLKVIVPRGLISPGSHTFQPVIRVSGGTATWLINTVFSQFFVGEIF